MGKQSIAGAGPSVRPAVSSSRGLIFLLVCNYHANFVHFGFTLGLRDNTPTPLEGSYGGTFHRGIIIAPFRRQNLCYAYTEYSFTASLQGLICVWFQIPLLKVIYMVPSDGYILQFNLKGGYSGSYRLQAQSISYETRLTFLSSEVRIAAASHLCACFLFPSSIFMERCDGNAKGHCLQLHVSFTWEVTVTDASGTVHSSTLTYITLFYTTLPLSLDSPRRH